MLSSTTPSGRSTLGMARPPCKKPQLTLSTQMQHKKPQIQPHHMHPSSLTCMSSSSTLHKATARTLHTDATQATWIHPHHILRPILSPSACSTHAPRQPHVHVIVLLCHQDVLVIPGCLPQHICLQPALHVLHPAAVNSWRHRDSGAARDAEHGWRPQMQSESAGEADGG